MLIDPLDEGQDAALGDRPVRAFLVMTREDLGRLGRAANEQSLAAGRIANASRLVRTCN